MHDGLRAGACMMVWEPVHAHYFFCVINLFTLVFIAWLIPVVELFSDFDV